MVLKYTVVDFKKLDLKGFKKFVEKYDYNVDISVKMDHSGVGIKVYDAEKELGISTQNARKVVDEDKEYLKNYEPDGLVYNIYLNCDYEFLINAKTPEELRLAYVFAIYISENTDMLLDNLDTHMLIDSECLKELLEVDLDKLCKEYEIRLKYDPEIVKLRQETNKSFYNSILFWILLVLASGFATVALIVMIFTYKIENFLVLSLPYVLIGFELILVIGGDYFKNVKIQKQLKKLYFERSVEIDKLFGYRPSKLPSSKIKNIKQTIIDLMGILIVPCMIGGSILIAFSKYVLGILIILVPWVVLIGIKCLVTDKNKGTLKNKFYLWLDEYFKEKKNEKIVALVFNLYEKNDKNWAVEIVGTFDFNANNFKWTLNDTCKSDYALFRFYSNSTWEDIEILISKMLGDYFKETDNRKVLKEYKGIAIGFIDGKARMIYVNSDEEVN